MTAALALIRARRALAAAGFEPNIPIERASSVTNEVWLTRDAVLRVNTQGDQRLRREALVTAVLPPEIGYPHLVAYGGDLSSDWLVVERVPGRPLSRCWPTMGREARENAVAQLAARLRVLHATPAPELPPLRDQPQLLQPAVTGAEAVAPLIAGLRRATGLPRVNPRLMMDLEAMVVETAAALEPFDATTLVHGDLTFENVLWDPHEQRITALLDFEWARQGPPDLDLDVLLRCVAYPKLHVAADYEHLTKTADYADVPWWLCESYPELFSYPRQLERVRLYAIAWDVRELLRFPPSDDPGGLHPAHPYHRLIHTIKGTSYLDRMDGSVPVPAPEGALPVPGRGRSA